MNGRDLQVYLEDHYDKDAAKELECSVYAIWKFRNRLNMPSYKKRLSKATAVYAWKLYNQGFTYTRITKLLGYKSNKSAHYYVAKGKEIAQNESRALCDSASSMGSSMPSLPECHIEIRP